MEPNSYLKLTIDRDDDGTGELHATVAANGFSGKGSAWFDLRCLAEFAPRLEAFPLSKENAPEIAGGFCSPERRGELEQVHFSLKAYPIGPRGKVGVRIRVATPVHQTDRPDSQHVAEVELETSYQALASFAKQLRKLAEGEAEQAVLAGEEL